MTTPRTGRRTPIRTGDALAALSLVLFGVLLVLVRTQWHPLHRLDLDVADGLNRWSAPRPALVDTLKVISTVGTPLTFQVSAVIAGVLLHRSGRTRAAVFVVVTVLGGALLGTIMKAFVDRARPTVEVTLSQPHGSSFPSGHTLTSFVAMTVLLILLLPALRASGRSTGRRAVVAAAAVLVAVLVAFSRLGLGVHYVSDVLGAWLLGTVWVLLMLRVIAPPPIRDAVRPPA